jgi:hypothetical protein
MKQCLAVPLALAAAMVSFFLNLAPSYAQAARTWVSGIGDDNNACSRTAPCKTFLGAYEQTAVNGEINCLDPGGFGNLLITKSVTIDCHGMVGTILDSVSTNGITINLAVSGITINFDSFGGSDAEKTVTIRNLTFQGAGAGGTGIVITGAGQGSLVNIEDCVVSGNFGGTFFSANRSGILDTRGHGMLAINNTTVRSMGVNGIVIESPNDGSRRAVIRNTRVINSGTGITVGANSEVTIRNSEIADNATAGLVVSASTGSVAVDSTSIAHNGYAFQNSGTVRLSNSDIAYNSTAWTGIINTFTNNRFTNNGGVGPLVPIGTAVNPTGEQ